MLSYIDARSQALAMLAGGAPEDGFHRICAWLSYPRDLPDEEHWRDALEVLARAGEPLVGEAFGDLARAAAREIDDAETLYDLGYALFDSRIYGVAATVLTRAHALSPDAEHVLTELTIALEELGRNRDARQLLRRQPALLEESFMCRYLLAFNAMMDGAVDEARAQLPELRASARGDEEAFMLGRIDAMLDRHRAARRCTSLDERDLRGWHFVLTGGLLTHLGPEGRYGRCVDSPALCHEGIRRLDTTLSALGLRPPRVFALPDRASLALGTAAAALLELPLEVCEPALPRGAGLLVAHDLDRVDDALRSELRWHRPDQLLWAHAARWTQPSSLSPDLCTLLARRTDASWVGMAAASATELAERILLAEPSAEALADLDRLEALARAARDTRSAALRRAGQRETLWFMGPVRSAPG